MQCRPSGKDRAIGVRFGFILEKYFESPVTERIL